MPMHRLLVPVIPTALWLGFDLWLPDLRRLSELGLAATATGFAVCILLQLASSTTGGRNLNSTAFVGAAVGRHIAAAWPRGSLVALNTAGSTPYYAPGLRSALASSRGPKPAPAQYSAPRGIPCVPIV